MSWPARLLTLGLLIAVLASAFGVIRVTYQTRVQFAQVEALRLEGQRLEEEWGRLLLEESAFSSPARVERLSREQLNMSEPAQDQMRWLERDGLTND
jgi:cell division protein FtsL